MPKIIGNPTVTPMAIPDWNQKDKTKADYIKNKPTVLTEEEIIDLISENGGGSGNVDLSNYYTKDETTHLVDSKISSVYKYCGSVDTLGRVPNMTLGENAGSTYNISTGGDLIGGFQNFAYEKPLKCVFTNSHLKIYSYEDKDITSLFLQGMVLEDIPEGIGFTLESLTNKGWVINTTFSEGTEIEITKASQYEFTCKDGDNIAWTGYCWDNLGGIIDISSLNEQINNKQDKSDIVPIGAIYNGATPEEFEGTYPSTPAMMQYVQDYTEGRTKDFCTKEDLTTVYKYCGSVDSIDALPNLTLGKSSGNTYNVANGSNGEVLKTFNCSFVGRTVDWQGSELGITIKDDLFVSHLFLPGTVLICNIDGVERSITLKRLEGDKWFVDFFGDVGWDGFPIIQYQTAIKCADGDNIAWTGYCWDNLGNVIDLSKYYTKDEVNNRILMETSGLPNHAYIQDEINLAISDRYTKTEIDNMIGDISTALDTIIDLQSQY